jgi:hypothetical protein
VVINVLETRIPVLFKQYIRPDDPMRRCHSYSRLKVTIPIRENMENNCADLGVFRGGMKAQKALKQRKRSKIEFLRH